MSKTEDIIKSLEQHFVSLTDTSTRDRPLKRRAMEAVKKETGQIKTLENTSAASIEILNQLVDSLLTCTQSQIESVREQSVLVLKSLVEGLEKGQLESSLLSKLLEWIKVKMTSEVTEEIRAEWMHFCISLLYKTTKVKTEQAELYLDIVRLASIDSFPEVQKLSAKTLSLFAENHSKMTDYSCDKCIELIKPFLVHKHTPIRVLGIQTVEAVALASPKGLYLLFEYDEGNDRQAIIPSLVFDSSALVRDHLFKMIGNLVCKWEPRERYQNGDKILPILFSGVFDELPSVQSTCRESLNHVGGICAQDLHDAGLIAEIPSIQEKKEALGLKHIVHMCYDECLAHLLDGSSDFIVVKQLTGLESLTYFLKYASVDDLVRSIKKLLSHLIKVYVNGYHEQVIKDKVFAIISLLSSQFPTPDLYLDVLLAQLESNYLRFEKNGYPGAVTVMVVVTFLDQFIVSSLNAPQPAAIERIASVLKKPHLKDYLNDLDHNSKEYLDHLNSI